jgi:isocitrate/isopropylmalate dehydrogenase
VIMAEAPHGTAPRLFGRNIANPMAMILAGAALLSYGPTDAYREASRAVYEATFETIQSGVRTVDLGGEATTTEFTDEIIRRVAAKLEVWRSFGRV